MDKSKRLFLVGFMGAGKSTVGRILAENLKTPFFDLDKIIESETNRKIQEIFNEYGEAYFRKLESEVLRKTVKSSDTFVISTGGGIILDRQNRDFLQAQGFSVYLKADIETIWHRLSGNTSRPLLHVDEPLSTAKKLLSDRSNLYDGADLTVITDHLTPGEVASEILDHLDGIKQS